MPLSKEFLMALADEAAASAIDSEAGAIPWSSSKEKEKKARAVLPQTKQIMYENFLRGKLDPILQSLKWGY